VAEQAQPQDQFIPLLGRRNEVRTLTAAFRERKSCLVVGPKGMGKTRLLQESLSISRQPFACVERPEVLHRLLVELAERLSCSADIRHATSVALKPLVLNALRKAPRCLVLENMAGADPRMYRFLQQVYHIPGACITATAASRDCLGPPAQAPLGPREEIVLKPLTRPEALSLFDLACRMYRLQSLDLEAFRRKVLTAAQGNPGQILTMCRMANRPEYQDGRHIKFLPLRMDALMAYVS